MAASTKSNMQIYQNQFWGGFVETIKQVSDAFNAASQGAITLVRRMAKGDFEQESMVQRVSGLITRRDVTSTSAATSLGFTQDEFKRVKLNRKIGPIDNTLDSWKKVAPSEDAISSHMRAYGIQSAKAMQGDMVDSGLIAVEAALDGVAAVEFDRTAGTMRTEDMIDGLSKMGDQAGEIVIWAMHSKPYFDLLKDQVADAVYRAGGVLVIQGVPATLNRPVLVIDSPALIEAGSPNNYVTLGLKAGAVDLVESEDREMEVETVTGLENLVIRIQGEYAYNVGVMGFKWTTTVNPTDAQLGTAANWTQVAASHKGLAGVAIKSR